MRIGIPRALTYYDHSPFWESFFAALGCDVLVSEPTSAAIVRRGLALAADDVCYPVKVMHGHVDALAAKVDKVFVPRLFSTMPQTCECPKLIGLPDMLRYSLPVQPCFLSPYVNLHGGRKALGKVMAYCAREVGFKDGRWGGAFRQAEAAWRARRASEGEETMNAHGERNDRGIIGVIGHAYNLDDAHLNLGIPEALKRQGFALRTPRMLSATAIEKANGSLRKPLFWSTARRVYGAGAYFSADPAVLGIVHLASFGCGLESLLVEMVRKVADAYEKPLLVLITDEHTGEAGVSTRLEAFLDMLHWQTEAKCV